MAAMAEPANPEPPNGTIQVSFASELYSLAAVKRVAYRLADRCTIAFDLVVADTVSVTFIFRPGTQEATRRESIRLFHQELLDEDLREQLREETDALRSLVLAHAFSRTDLIKRS